MNQRILRLASRFERILKIADGPEASQKAAPIIDKVTKEYQQVILKDQSLTDDLYNKVAGTDKETQITISPGVIVKFTTNEAANKPLFNDWLNQRHLAPYTNKLKQALAAEKISPSDVSGNPKWLWDQNTG